MNIVDNIDCTLARTCNTLDEILSVGHGMVYVPLTRYLRFLDSYDRPIARYNVMDKDKLLLTAYCADNEKGNRPWIDTMLAIVLIVEGVKHYLITSRVYLTVDTVKLDAFQAEMREKAQLYEMLDGLKKHIEEHLHDQMRVTNRTELNKLN